MANKFPQTITFWAVSVNGNGDYTYSSPVTVAARWEDKQELFIDGNKQEVLSKAIVYTKEPIELLGYVAKGDHVATSDPTTVSGSYQVRGYGEVPSLNGRKQVNKAYL